MQTNRWKLVALSAASGVMLAACEDIIVNVLDRTPPEVALAHSGRTPARFAGSGLEVTFDDPVMPGEAFILQPARATETTTLIPVARDTESAIRNINANVELTFTCSAVVPGGPVSREARAVFSASALTPDAAGSETKDTEAVSISYTLKDAWERAGCDRWGAFIDVPGRMSNIRGVVRSSVQNNAQPVVGASFLAPFTYSSSYSISY